MRNSWYPHQLAEYIATVRDVNPKTVTAERDYTFGMEDPKDKKALESAYDPVTLGPTPKAKTKTSLLTVSHLTDNCKSRR